MHISNPTQLAICNLRRWMVQNGLEVSHVIEYYRHVLAQQKADRHVRG
jgi:hypothetical protein